MTSRRLYAPVVLALLASGGLAFFAATRTWVRATVETSGMPSDRIAVSGKDTAPELVAFALVLAAAALAVLATAGWVRRGVGVLVVATSLYAAVLAKAVDPELEPMTVAVLESPAFTGNHPEVLTFTNWQFVTVVAFLAASIIGILVVLLAGRWPTMGRRYESPAAPIETEDDLWSALDEGRDPTE